MASWFVRPETALLPLSDGQSITVRRRLTAGEWRARMARSADYVDGELRINPFKRAMATVTAYLLDWTVTDDGAPVPIRGLSVADLDTLLDNLDRDRFAELHAAIAAHEDAMDAERTNEKKTDGATASSPTLPSPVGAGGGTNG